MIEHLPGNDEKDVNNNKDAHTGCFRARSSFTRLLFTRTMTAATALMTGQATLKMSIARSGAVNVAPKIAVEPVLITPTFTETLHMLATAAAAAAAAWELGACPMMHVQWRIAPSHWTPHRQRSRKPVNVAWTVVHKP